MNTHFFGLYSKKCDLDIFRLHRSCLELGQMLKDHFTPDPAHNFGAVYEEYTTFQTEIYKQYNVLSYPLPEVHKLYSQIRDFFYECQKKHYGKILKKNYYIQCWLNIYQRGHFLDWHNHATIRNGAPSILPFTWHGFFCVNVGNSVTSYKFQKKNIVDVQGTNNLLVLGVNNSDLHRTYPWTEDTPRITIAFDIVPENYVISSEDKLTDLISKYPYLKNHWIPI